MALPAHAEVGVVGGGAMGAGIAQVAAAAGHPVVVLEVDQERADSAVGTPAATVDTAVRLGVGYPLGPLAWGDRVGAAWLVGLLNTLERLMPGGRYRVSTPLRRAAVTGGSLREL